MSKRPSLTTPLPWSKRRLLEDGSYSQPKRKLNFDLSLHDELVLTIFSHLPWNDLCAIQSTNRHWSRLATDNQLWKFLYIREFDRQRLRGSRGFSGRRDGREMRPLPREHAQVEDLEGLDWKWMFRISSNWRKGRSEVQQLVPSEHDRRDVSPAEPISCILLTGSLLVSTSSRSARNPEVVLHHRRLPPVSLSGLHKRGDSTNVSALALDQSRPSRSDGMARLAAFYDTGEFSIFAVDSSNPRKSRRLTSYHPRTLTARTKSIRRAVYHHPLLATLSNSFQLSLYDLSDALVEHGSIGQIRHTQTLASFTSFPPTSMVLTPGRLAYRLLLAYSAPVYPAHWGIAVTVLTISRGRSQLNATAADLMDRPCTVLSSRTIRSFDIPVGSGWLDEYVTRQMREQWGRKVAKVADVQTDGKWLVISAESSLQLYRLYLPSSSITSSLPPPNGVNILDGVQSPSGARMTFVRMLHGHTSPVVASAVSDGRCVSLGKNGSVWVWDLEEGWSVEVQGGSQRSAFPAASFAKASESDEQDIPSASIAFDERQIVISDSAGVEIRRFDI